MGDHLISVYWQLLFKLKGYIEDLNDKKALSELIHLMGDAGHSQVF